MEGLEILIMKNLIIVLLFSSISMNAQLDTNPFISNTEKITAFSLEGTQWYNVPTSLSSGTTYFQFFSDVIQDYSEFSSGYAPESAKYANKKLYTNIKEYNSTKQRGTLYGYPTYWRLYSLGPEPAQFDFLRIVNQQEGVYDFDLTNYTQWARNVANVEKQLASVTTKKKKKSRFTEPRKGVFMLPRGKSEKKRLKSFSKRQSHRPRKRVSVLSNKRCSSQWQPQ